MLLCFAALAANKRGLHRLSGANRGPGSALGNRFVCARCISGNGIKGRGEHGIARRQGRSRGPRTRHPQAPEGVTVCALASCRAAVTAFWGLLATWVALARERIAGAALEAGADSLAVWMLFTTSSSTLIEVTDGAADRGDKVGVEIIFWIVSSWVMSLYCLPSII